MNRKQITYNANDIGRRYHSVSSNIYQRSLKKIDKKTNIGRKKKNEFRHNKRSTDRNRVKLAQKSTQ